MVPRILSSHCSNVSPLLELGLLPAAEVGRSRFCGVTDVLDGVILTSGESPLLCLRPNCEKGFCGEAVVLVELDMFIFGFGASISGGGAFELGVDFGSPFSLLMA